LRPESQKYLWDALNAAGQIADFVAGKDLAAYRSDNLLRSGVERQMEIIGEALARMARHDPETADLIPELGRIVAFRNILIHGYADVDDTVVWGVIEMKLSPLRETLRRLLEETSKD
jgi:uncharacterized protein with HEPN domain